MSVLFCSGYFFYTASRVIFPKTQIWLRLNFLPLFAPLYPRSKIQRTQLGNSPKLQSHWWSPCINSCPPLHPHRTFDFPLGTSRLATSLCPLLLLLSVFLTWSIPWLSRLRPTETPQPSRLPSATPRQSDILHSLWATILVPIFEIALTMWYCNDLVTYLKPATWVQDDCYFYLPSPQDSLRSMWVWTIALSIVSSSVQSFID